GAMLARPKQRLSTVRRASGDHGPRSAARQHRPARLQRRALPRAGHRLGPGAGLPGPRAHHKRQRLHRPDRGDLRRLRPAGRPRALCPEPAQPRGGAELRPLLPPRARHLLQVGGARRPPRARLPVPHRGRARGGAGGGAVHHRGGGDRPRGRGAPDLPQRLP
ncbi:MAG: Glycosyltransferase, partial [uncultured Acetobacteraceae bacterium]